MSRRSGLETRRLYALARQEVLDGRAVDPQHAAHTHGIESSVVDEPPDRLGMDAELVGNLTHADEMLGFFRGHRHFSPSTYRSEGSGASLR
jgi:hypothetical protein